MSRQRTGWTRSGQSIGGRDALLAVLVWLVLVFAPINDALAQDIDSLIDGGSEEAAAAEEGDEPRRVIETDSSPERDQAIRERLETIFSELDELDRIDVSVTSGVVTLSGVAASSTASARALALAQQVESVVEVVDALRVDQSVGRRLSTTLERLASGGRTLLAMLPILFVALLAIAFFWWLSRRISLRTPLLGRFAPNPLVAELLVGTARLVVIVLGIALALSLLDATELLGTVLGAAGIVGLAVGFAVRDTVENYIASLLLSLRNPFRARDLVSIDGIEGHVARLTSRATILISLEGNHIRVPNSTVFKAVIVNYSRDPARRFDFSVGIDTDLAVRPAQTLAERTVGDVAGVLDDPPPFVLVENLGDSSVSLRVHGWVDVRDSDWRKVRSEAIRLVKRAFDAADILMPEPIYRVRLDPRGAALPIGRAADKAVGESDADENAIESTAESASGPRGTPSVKALESAESGDTRPEPATLDTLEREIRTAGESLLDERSAQE